MKSVISIINNTIEEKIKIPLKTPLNDTMHIFKDLHLSMIDLLEICMKLEYKLQIEIDDSDCEILEYVGDMYLVVEKLKKSR